MQATIRTGAVVAAGGKSGAMATLLTVMLLACLGSMYCQSKVWAIEAEGRYLTQHAREAGEQFSATLNRAAGEQQLAAFDERLLLVEETFAWKRVQFSFVAMALFTGLAAYLLHALHQARTSGARVWAPVRAS